MEQTLLEVIKWIFAKSDPMLAACVLVLGYWQFKTNKKLQDHMNPDPKDNPSPHPQCNMHSAELNAVVKQMDKNHAETRRSVEKAHEMTREDINNLSERIETVLRLTVQDRK